ncbi:SCO7613 C-terminal domain-containing membrane protein [Streptomyces sp. NPDC002250]|uniref:SCO7613 C-terminal domain-containing membrane protein n=1 Tax=Streptomyces sp. NPDC002250 TaxID=3364641 RepID=UPI003681A5D8
MTPVPPPAEELRLIDAELWQLDARRVQLLARRAWLLGLLSSPPQPGAVPPAAAAAPQRPEATAPRVQNVLLLLGGLLLTIAAVAFTLVGWGHLGIAGRSLVLGAVTVAALAAPLPLLKRGLRSTAEAVAGLALALTVLDAYALHAVALTGVDATAYAAWASAVLAAVWSGYGLLPRVRTLRLPLPAALTAAQLPLPLGAVAADAGTLAITGALLLTAALDTAAALRAPAGLIRITATAGAYGVGAWGALGAVWLSWTAGGPGAGARAAALLVFAAGVALAAAWRDRAAGHAVGLSIAAGLLAVIALGGVVRPVLPAVWAVPAHLLLGVALLAAVRADRLPERVRRGLAVASAAVQGLAVLWTLPLLALTLLGPAGWAAQVWSGAPSGARQAVSVSAPWLPWALPAPLVLATVATVLVLAIRSEAWRPKALTGALVLGWAAVVVVPMVTDLPYPAVLVMESLTTAVLLAMATRPRLTERTGTLPALVLALLTSFSLALLSLPTKFATVAVLTALTALFAGVSRKRRLAAVTVPAALGYGAAWACAVGAAAGWAPQRTALLVLLVPAVAALFAARNADARTTVVAEVTGAAAGLLAIGLALGDPAVLSLTLGLCAAILAGTALRADRRPAAHAATALFALAAWVRLAAWGVTAPEAYTAPVSVVALVLGVLRRRRDPQASSWVAYGPGLAATLVPSLAAACTDAYATRPWLLGAAALLVTLTGARHRLRAPLLLGGGVLVLDALHELAPYLVQITGLLPRWAPPALAGLLLLAVGATYEQRLRDVRRARDVLSRMN